MPEEMTLHQEIKEAIKAFYASEFSDVNGSYFRMPDGSVMESGICTNIAEFMAEWFGRDRCVIVGYSIYDNPKAKAGRDVEGHDFLILDKVVIIDIWLFEYEGGPRVTYLSNTKTVKKWYGERKKWVLSGSYAEDE